MTTAREDNRPDVVDMVDATGHGPTSYYEGAAGAQFGMRFGVLFELDPETGQPLHGEKGVGRWDPLSTRYHVMDKGDKLDRRIAPQIVVDSDAPYAGGAEGEAPKQHEAFTAANRSTRWADRAGRVAIGSSTFRLTGSEDGRYVPAIHLREVELGLGAGAAAGKTPLALPPGMQITEAGTSTSSGGTVSRSQPQVSFTNTPGVVGGALTVVGQAAVDAAKEVIASGGTLTQARDAALSVGRGGARPKTQEKAPRTKFPFPLDHPDAYVQQGQWAGLFSSLVTPAGRPEDLIFGWATSGLDAGMRWSPLALRFDAHVTMGEALCPSPVGTVSGRGFEKQRFTTRSGVSFGSIGGLGIQDPTGFLLSSKGADGFTQGGSGEFGFFGAQGKLEGDRGSGIGPVLTTVDQKIARLVVEGKILPELEVMGTAIWKFGSEELPKTEKERAELQKAVDDRIARARLQAQKEGRELSPSDVSSNILGQNDLAGQIAKIKLQTIQRAIAYANDEAIAQNLDATTVHEARVATEIETKKVLEAVQARALAEAASGASFRVGPFYFSSNDASTVDEAPLGKPIKGEMWFDRSVAELMNRYGVVGLALGAFRPVVRISAQDIPPSAPPKIVKQYVPFPPEFDIRPQPPNPFPGPIPLPPIPNPPNPGGPGGGGGGVQGREGPGVPCPNVPTDPDEPEVFIPTDPRPVVPTSPQTPQVPTDPGTPPGLSPTDPSIPTATGPLGPQGPLGTPSTRPGPFDEGPGWTRVIPDPDSGFVIGRGGLSIPTGGRPPAGIPPRGGWTLANMPIPMLGQVGGAQTVEHQLALMTLALNATREVTNAAFGGPSYLASNISLMHRNTRTNPPTASTIGAAWAGRPGAPLNLDPNVSAVQMVSVLDGRHGAVRAIDRRSTDQILADDRNGVSKGGVFAYERQIKGNVYDDRPMLWLNNDKGQTGRVLGKIIDTPDGMFQVGKDGKVVSGGEKVITLDPDAPAGHYPSPDGFGGHEWIPAPTSTTYPIAPSVGTATATGSEAFAAGPGANADGLATSAFGTNSNADGVQSSVFGAGATADSSSPIATVMGVGAFAVSAPSAAAYGYQAFCEGGTGGTALGRGTYVFGNYGIALGFRANAIAQQMVVGSSFGPVLQWLSYDDNVTALGDATRRFSNVYAADATIGDLTFTDEECVACGKPLKVGDELLSLVIKVSREKGLRKASTVPIHVGCGKHKKRRVAA